MNRIEDVHSLSSVNEIFRRICTRSGRSIVLELLPGADVSGNFGLEDGVAKPLVGSDEDVRFRFASQRYFNVEA